MNEQVAIQTLLRTKLVEIQQRNPAYSLRSYAKKVGIHIGALSHILNGKRNVSRKLAERITRRLMLDPQERSEVLGLFPSKKRSNKLHDSQEVLEARYLEFSALQYKVAAEWEYFAVLSLIKCKDAINSIDWVAKRLGISKNRAKQVVEQLIQLELIQVRKDNALVRSSKCYRTPDDVADVALKKHHDETLNLARDSLFQNSIADRDMTSITMAIDPKKICAAKEIIRKFEDDLSDLLESGSLTEVYRLSVQLFPLTKLEKETL